MLVIIDDSGMPEEHEQMEEKLQRKVSMSLCSYYFYDVIHILLELCLQNLNSLEANSLVKMDDGFILQPTGICSSVHTHTRHTNDVFIFRDWSVDGSLLCGI